MLTPAFHFKILDDFMVVFNKHTETFVKILSSKAGPKAFNVFPLITHCALDIIMGKDDSSFFFSSNLKFLL